MSGVLPCEENGQPAEEAAEEAALRRGRQLFRFISSNAIIRRHLTRIRVDNLREALHRTEAEFRALRDCCSLEQLALQEVAICKVRKLKKMLETSMNLRDVGSVGCMLSAIGRAIAISKNASSDIKVGLMSIGLLSALLATSQRKNISRLVTEIRQVLQEDLERFQGLSQAAQDLDEALYRCLGVRLFSEQFHQILDRLLRPAEPEGESAFDVMLESLAEEVQEALKNVSANNTVKGLLQRVVDGTVRRYIHCSLVTHYVGLVFEMAPDTLEDTDAEVILLPLQFACHCILFLNERSSDARKLDEVDGGIERMTDELSLMRKVKEFCDEVRSRDPH